MKIDRLLGLVVYLLNRDIVSARTLAERFEVSQRTIQRDIETLGLAGIPVIAVQGANGGYGIADTFRMRRQALGTDDYAFILTALKGLCSAYENRRLAATLEKLIASSPGADSTRQHIHIDLGVSREGAGIRDNLTAVEAGIKAVRAIEFDYADAAGSRTHRRVDPLIIMYRWYAWYLFAYCHGRSDYRLFRLSRMRDVAVTDEGFAKSHGDTEALLAERSDARPCLDIKLRCRSELRVAIEEAFPGARVRESDLGSLIVEFSVPRNERGWFSMLMGFGGSVTVVEPEELRTRLLVRAQEIVAQYG